MLDFFYFYTDKAKSALIKFAIYSCFKEGFGLKVKKNSSS
jgi:hypothetical protein